MRQGLGPDDEQGYHEKRRRARGGRPSGGSLISGMREPQHEFGGEESLLVGLSGGVLTLTLNRPEVLNSFTRSMAQAMQGALQRAATDDEVRPLLVT